MIRELVRALITVAVMLLLSPGTFFQAQEAQLTRIDELVAGEEYQKAIIAIDQMNEKQVLINRKTDYYYSVCYNRIGLHDIALDHSEIYLSNSSDKKGKYENAIAYFGTGNYEQAVDRFDDIESHYKDDQEFLYYYGTALYYTEDYQAALERLERVIREKDDYDYLNYNLYQCYYETEEYERGLRQVEKDMKALNKENEYYQYDWEDLLYYRADFYYLRGSYQEAMADYETLIEEDSYYLDEVYYLLAKCYAQLGDYELVYNNIELGLEYDSYYYYEVYKYDEDLQDFFEDERYTEKIEILEQIYENYYYYYEKETL